MIYMKAVFKLINGKILELYRAEHGAMEKPEFGCPF